MKKNQPHTFGPAPASLESGSLPLSPCCLTPRTLMKKEGMVLTAASTMGKVRMLNSIWPNSETIVKMSQVTRMKAHVYRTFGLMKRGERMRLFTIKTVIPLTRTASAKKLRVFKIVCGPKSKEVMERKESNSKGIGRIAAHIIGDVAGRFLP